MNEEIVDFMDQYEEIASATMRWLREHGYFIAYDEKMRCFRIILEGIDRKDDTPYPAVFNSRRAAYYRALQLIGQE